MTLDIVLQLAIFVIAVTLFITVLPPVRQSMTTADFLSALMNNVGVVAMLLAVIWPRLP